ncbi:MAG: rRNA maturation RNase YbeY [Candidatus Eisenbacteria bacterium]
MQESDGSSSLDIRGLPVQFEDLRPLLKKAAEDVLAEHDVGSYAISVSFVDDSEISRINKESLDRSGATDVIAFDLSEDGLPIEKVGDVYISIDTVVENSARFGVRPEEELLRVVVHGILHVLGYEDGDPASSERMTEVQEMTVKKAFR